jgi:hypothetical protein
MIAVAIALIVVAGPLLLGLTGVRAPRTSDPGAGAVIRWSWKLTLGSALLYALAYNLTFFVQELFLVLPKAFVPGVRPTLFHNNHTWQGDNPLTSLFQGTGALRVRAIFQVATLPALIGTALTVPFRMPREAIEVLLPPAIAMVAGVAWVQAGAWCVRPADGHERTGLESITYPLAAVLALLLAFQLLLRRGVPFY